MKTAQRVVAIAVVVGAGAIACGDAVRAPITIVVDTDRVRVREEQGRLEELRAGVQGDRAELEAARVELQRARQRLEETSRGPQRDALQDEVKALEARLGERQPTALTRGDLDAALAASEQRLLAGIAAGAVPNARRADADARPPVAVDAAAALALERLGRARSALAEKGLAIADLTTGTADVERINGLLEQGKGAAAASLAEELRLVAVAVVVDKLILLRRYTRLNERAKQLRVGDERQARVKGLLKTAMTALSAGDLTTATAALEDLGRDLGN